MPERIEVKEVTEYYCDACGEKVSRFDKCLSCDKYYCFNCQRGEKGNDQWGENFFTGVNVGNDTFVCYDCIELGDEGNLPEESQAIYDGLIWIRDFSNARSEYLKEPGEIAKKKMGELRKLSKIFIDY